MDAALSNACNWLADHQRVTCAVLMTLIYAASLLDAVLP